MGISVLLPKRTKRAEKGVPEAVAAGPESAEDTAEAEVGANRRKTLKNQDSFA
jgi:hypothetical protein